MRELTWAPDGTHIAFLSQVAPDLHLVDVDDHAITTLAVPGVLLGSMDWQPLPPCTVHGTDLGEEVQGSPVDDVICAGGGDDTVVATAGHDVILAWPGRDTVTYQNSEVPTILTSRLSTRAPRGERDPDAERYLNREVSTAATTTALRWIRLSGRGRWSTSLVAQNPGASRCRVSARPAGSVARSRTRHGLVSRRGFGSDGTGVSGGAICDRLTVD